MAKPPVQRPYKLVIRDAIMEALYAKMKEIADQEFADLVRRNAAISGFSHLSFGYNGKFYNLEPTQGPPVRQRLHDSMLPAMRSYLDEFGYPLQMETAKIEGYLSSMMAYSPYPGDYLLLLPAALHAVVRSAVTCDWSTSISPEKIASFMAKYQPGYELIRQRMAINLII